jgi:hypothetical protein
MQTFVEGFPIYHYTDRWRLSALCRAMIGESVSKLAARRTVDQSSGRGGPFFLPISSWQQTDVVDRFASSRRQGRI